MEVQWRIELLGWLRATCQTEVVRRFRLKKVGGLLAYLAYYHHRSHPREELIELLWPECDVEVGRNRLSVALTSLRHQLEPPAVPTGSVILADAAAVQLNPAVVCTDVAAFEAALQAARADRGAGQRYRLEEAVALYRGELLPGYLDDWTLPERQRLAEAHLQALVRLIALMEEAGDHHRAVQHARRVVAADPLREESQQALIRLLDAAGRPDAALRQYRDLEQLLAAELGVSPAPELAALARDIQRRATRVNHPARESWSPAETRRDSAAGGSKGGANGGGLTKAEPRAGGQTEGSVRNASPALASPAQVPAPGTRAAGGDLPVEPSPEVSPPAGTVTFLLADVEGSTALREPAGETGAPAITVHHPLLRRTCREHGGCAVREAGSLLIAVFPRASDALRAAVAGQCDWAAHARPEGIGPLRVRMALDTAEVALQEGNYPGSVFDRATRIVLAAHGGQILCSEESAALLHRDLEPGVHVADLGIYRLLPAAMPEHLFQVDYPEMAPREFPPPRVAAGYADHLPLQLSRFFGREDEIARLQELLSPPCRLVTLTGLGGSGKTRLALAVAGRLRARFQGAVWFVPLQDLCDPGLIVDKVTASLHFPHAPYLEPLEQLVAFLSRQPSLLLLDNFEHLLAGPAAPSPAALEGPGGAGRAAALVQTLLERVPALTVLVTSRQRLGLPGEREFAVAPLPIPVDGITRSAGTRLMVDGPMKIVPADPSTINRVPAERVIPSTLLQCASVRLFVDRAQAARPDFQLMPANAAAVAALCQKLEGLPLALELAAARVAMLTPGQMLSRLEQRFELLTSRGRAANARHHSLRAALDWSYQMLSPALQRFLAHLSVFRGGFTLAATEAVCEEPLALDYLSELQECSLVLAEETAGFPSQAEMRYRLLELVREYAAEQVAVEDQAALSRRHAQFFLTLAEASELMPTSRPLEERFQQLEREHDNLRAALAWWLENETPESGLRLAMGMWRLWYLRGYWSEGRAWLERALARADGAWTKERAQALRGAGKLAWCQGDYPAARSLLEESLAILREQGDVEDLAAPLNALGEIAHTQGDDETARSLFTESLAILRKHGDKPGMAWSLQALGQVALEQRDAAAPALFQESLVLFRELGDRWGLSFPLSFLGEVAHAQGDLESARSLHEESLAIRREIGHKGGIARSLGHLGTVAAAQEEYEEARSLYAECLALRRELGEKSGIAACLEGLAGVLGQQAGAGSAAARGVRRTGATGSPRVAAASRVASLPAVAALTRAAQLFGAAAALREVIGVPLAPTARASYDRSVAAVRAALGQQAFAAARIAGQAMPLDQAIASALAEAEQT